MAATSGKCIFNRPFDEITDGEISIADKPIEKFRFLDCRSFAERKSLRIFQFDQLPTEKYGAISYIWSGLKPKTVRPQIKVADTEGKGVVDVEILRIACAALLPHCDFLWVDVLCIIQGESLGDSKLPNLDRPWQMQHMYDIYSSCVKCLIVPGGLQQLTEITEDTPWVHRAWTLQEAIAPKSAEFLFSWEHGDCVLQTNWETAVTEVEKGVAAATAEMESLLATALKSSYLVLKDAADQDSPGGSWEGKKIKMLGQYSQIQALVGALDMRGKEGMQNAIWRSAFMRTAHDPVDNVYSIMGVLGVTLDPKQFKTTDRIKATLALMRELLRKGERAEWLGVATRTNSNFELSTIPAFPVRSKTTGKFEISTPEGKKEVATVMDGWWMIADTPRGTLDEEGYLELEVLAASISKSESESPESGFEAVNGSKWDILSTHQGPTYAVFVGTKTFYLNGSAPTMVDPNDQVLMLIEEISSGKYRSLGYAFASEELRKGDAWSRATFKVGGHGDAVEE
ncbi:hypothetical protein EDB81DRAFT_138365 [Dactylonectria macrodidyma]|uniref:Heterokaryon incompatibility domain-containing protein n=1 Tax=Dactylonectria macrodidyma TaxID=307937 RepID=A0A9P9E1G3_9HYPO|nr:hypothetical protein EDB81DRAFT_138365 [Dactylonectria macrodidyma]